MECQADMPGNATVVIFLCFGTRNSKQQYFQFVLVLHMP